MATHDYVIANGTGAAVRSDLNGALAAIVSQNSSATEPSPSYAYQRWADITAGVMKMRNGANNAWITLYQLDGEWSTIAFENGTAAAPSIYFKDSGTDTGIYSPGADQVGISTGGTSRLAVSTTAVSSTLAVDVPLGAVGTPSITFTGDLNTGVFSPGADTLALVTGGTNRVHVTSGGLVGFGTTSPAATSTQTNQSTATVSAGISLFNSSGVSQAIVGLAAAGSGGGSDALYLSGASNIQLVTGSNERARIDSSGRLLVGTSSTTGNVRAVFSGWGSNPTQQGIVRIQRGSLPTSGQTIADVEFADDSNNLGAGLTAVAEANWASGTSHPSRLVFSTTADGAASPTERMRINSSGAFKASSNGSYTGATSAYHEFYQTTNVIGLFIRGTNASQTSSILEINGDRTTTNASYNLIDAYNGNVSGRFSVRDSGNAVNTNNSYGAISDIKLKENIVDAGSQWADIKAFRVRKYNFKEGQKHTQIGGIAQEVELISPGLVTESPDRDAEGNDLGTVTKSVNYSVLYMKAVKALQEAMERIETLEASNADMLARVTALEAA